MAENKGKLVVMCYQKKVIEVFTSVSGMCKQMKFDRRSVLRCLKGEAGYRTVKGYWFEYPDPSIPIEEYKRNNINPRFKRK